MQRDTNENQLCTLYWIFIILATGENDSSVSHLSLKDRVASPASTSTRSPNDQEIRKRIVLDFAELDMTHKY